jgi:PHD/YefM family antitoxin component YafN of YafNO toxin-antitoxin module
MFVPKKQKGIFQMKILTKAIVSNSDMIKNYKSCREKAEGFGKIFVLKNNQPDAVLFSMAEYERLSGIIEYLESLDENDIARFTESLPVEGIREGYSINHLRDDIKRNAANEQA